MPDNCKPKIMPGCTGMCGVVKLAVQRKEPASRNNTVAVRPCL